MNGRVYSPKLGKFLSPDPVTQAPENGQNYNRYSYVFNNPLKYTDPSGFTACTLAQIGCVIVRSGSRISRSAGFGGYRAFVYVTAWMRASIDTIVHWGAFAGLSFHSRFSLSTAPGQLPSLQIGPLTSSAFLGSFFETRTLSANSPLRTSTTPNEGENGVPGSYLVGADENGQVDDLLVKFARLWRDPKFLDAWTGNGNRLGNGVGNVIYTREQVEENGIHSSQIAFDEEDNQYLRGRDNDGIWFAGMEARLDDSGSPRTLLFNIYNATAITARSSAEFRWNPHEIANRADAPYIVLGTGSHSCVVYGRTQSANCRDL